MHSRNVNLSAEWPKSINTHYTIHNEVNERACVLKIDRLDFHSKLGIITYLVIHNALKSYDFYVLHTLWKFIVRIKWDNLKCET